MLSSLATYAIITDPSVSPRFDLALTLKDSYHPILKTVKETLLRNKAKNQTSIVSNDTAVTNDLLLKPRSSFGLITGANMSGKSTFLKQYGLLQIMSQMGSFIPGNKHAIAILIQLGI